MLKDLSPALQILALNHRIHILTTRGPHNNGIVGKLRRQMRKIATQAAAEQNI